jgi:hypothetical protein
MAPAIRLRAIDVRHAVDTTQLRAREHLAGLLTPSSGIGRQRHNPRPTKAGVSEIQKCGWSASASRQVASVTPNPSSICSERIQPGVTATAVQVYSSSSAYYAIAIRATLAFTRS